MVDATSDNTKATIPRDAKGAVTAVSSCASCGDKDNPNSDVHTACAVRMDETLFRITINARDAAWVDAVLKANNLIGEDKQLLNASAGDAATQFENTNPTMYGNFLTAYQQSLAVAKNSGQFPQAAPGG